MLDAMKITKSLAKGAWTGKSGTACCPAHEDKTPSLSISQVGEKILVKCHAGCEQSEVIAALTELGLWTKKSDSNENSMRAASNNVQRTKHEKTIKRIWQDAKAPIANDLLHIYFSNRGLPAPDSPAIRFSKSLYYSKGQSFPAVVAAVFLRPEDKEPLAVHRTYLRPDGRGKADVDSPRKLLGPFKGGAIWLKHDPNADTIAIGEGLETSQSVAFATGLPAASCVSSGNMKWIKIPQNYSNLLLLRDNDEAGAAAVNAAGLLFAAMGFHVRIAAPSQGNDFNDALQSGGAPAVQEDIENATEFDHPQLPICRDLFDAVKKADRSRIAGAYSALQDIDAAAAIIFHNRFKLIRDVEESKTSKEEEGDEDPLLLLTEQLQVAQDRNGRYFIETKGSAAGNYFLEDRAAEDFVRRMAVEQYRLLLSGDRVKNVIATVRACADPEKIPVKDAGTRVAYSNENEKHYLNLSPGIIEIDRDGWRIVSETPVRFFDRPGMLPLPTPVRGGDIERMKRFFVGLSEADFSMLFCWMCCALIEMRQYSILANSGPHGAAKSAFATMCRGLIDPNASPLRSLPRSEQDLFISTENSHLMCFDNLSSISSSASDSLCRLATGGGFSTRLLYTGRAEELFNASRPIILNSIAAVTDRADLADRTLSIRLSRIPEPARVPIDDLMREFEDLRPSFLGLLLDGVVEGLARIDDMPRKGWGRMSEFERFASACETAFFATGSFKRARIRQSEEDLRDMLDRNPIAASLMNFMREGYDGSKKDQTFWEGSALELHSRLTQQATIDQIERRSWPADQSVLMRQISRIEPELQKAGLLITRSRRGAAGDRVTRISWCPGFEPGDDNAGAESDEAPGAPEHTAGWSLSI